MSSFLDKIPSFSDLKSRGKMLATEAEHVRDLVREYAGAERHLGQAEVFHRIAVATGLTKRRVKDMFLGRLPRVWADEYVAILAWHDDWVTHRLDQLSHERLILEARRSARKVA
jgi:hypothetical protein